MRKATLLSILLLMSLGTFAQSVRRVPVLRVQFPDCEFSTSEEHMQAIAGRAGQYFTDQFCGQCTFTFDLGPVVTLAEPASYYGRNATDRKDFLLYKAVQEACFASEKDMDFRLYDCDSDNTVDNICIVFAGNSEAGADNPDLIWSQQDRLSSFDASILIQGRKIDSFSISAEADSLGTLCHEYGHALGLPDLYDVDGDGSGGLSEGLWGSISLMDRGNLNDRGCTPPNFTAIEMDILNLGNCEELRTGSFNLQPLSREKRFLKAGTPNQGEYFLFECRDNEGWDSAIGGSGLLICHIDKSGRDAGYSDYYRVTLTAYERWRMAQINCRPDHPCATICKADPDALEASEVFYHGNIRKSFGSDTKPAFRTWKGEPSSLAVTGIRHNPDGSVSFEVIVPVLLGEVLSFQDAAILDWETDESLSGISETMVKWSSGAGDLDSLKVGPQARCCTIEHLKPFTVYDVDIQVRLSNGDAFSASTQLKTKYWRKELQPYIFLGSAERSADGLFLAGSRIPLRVCNCPDAAEVRWTLDGQEIGVGSDGYYTMDRSGVLKAEVFYTDGTRDVLIKNLKLAK